MVKAMIAAIVAVVMVISTASAEIYLSHNLFLDVQSSSDGNGNFTYSFTGSSDNPDFGFYFTDSLGTISIPAMGVETVQTPPGWQGSASSDGLVTFQYTGSGGLWIHDTPVIFSLSSSISATKVYDGVGETSAPFTEFGNPNNGGWGTESFSYLGPVAVPEPSATAFWFSGMISLALASWKIRNEMKAELSARLQHFI